jgi:hypothetical protein
LIYYIDIDNTICKTQNSDYENSTPISSRIERINNLYIEGHHITYWTARGSRSGKDWSKLTLQQLDDWGCLRHNVIFNKPVYDYYIDDKSINDMTYFGDQQ